MDTLRDEMGFPFEPGNTRAHNEAMVRVGRMNGDEAAEIARDNPLPEQSPWLRGEFLRRFDLARGCMLRGVIADLRASGAEFDVKARTRALDGMANYCIGLWTMGWQLGYIERAMSGVLSSITEELSEVFLAHPEKPLSDRVRPVLRLVDAG
jgi:hypothetical protein